MSLNVFLSKITLLCAAATTLFIYVMVLFFFSMSSLSSARSYFPEPWFLIISGIFSPSWEYVCLAITWWHCFFFWWMFPICYFYFSVPFSIFSFHVKYLSISFFFFSSWYWYSATSSSPSPSFDYYLPSLSEMHYFVTNSFQEISARKRLE